MKSRLRISTLSATVFLATSFAFAETPLLEKSFGPGFIPQHLAAAGSCGIYKDRIETFKRVSTVVSKEVLRHELSGDVQDLIKKAALGKIEEETAPTDMPTTFHTAYKEDGTAVVLKAWGSVRKNNVSNEAKTLRMLTDMLCSNVNFPAFN